MNDLHLREVADDDEALLGFARAVTRHFHEDELAHWLPLLRETRNYAVEDRGRIVGNWASLPVTVSVPGGDPLPCAGVTAVGVSQLHRRRGVLRRLMRAGLDDARERGQPVAALFASESAIYPRFGYGVAAPMVGYRIDSARTRFLDPVDTRLVEGLDPGDAVAEAVAVCEVVAATRPGLVSRTSAEWHLSVVADPASWRDGASGRRLVHVPGRGYAIYRVKDEFRDGLPAGEVRVTQLVAIDAEAEQALWQHLLEVDLTTHVVTYLRPPDDALPWMVVDRLRLGTTTASPLYVRLLDVPRCLASRTSSVTDGLVLEVVDHERDQGGCYRWDVSPHGSACSRTDATPDVRLSVEALAAVWLGGTAPTQLLRARRLEERTPGAVARLDAVVATRHAPWTPWEF